MSTYYASLLFYLSMKLVAQVPLFSFSLVLYFISQLWLYSAAHISGFQIIS